MTIVDLRTDKDYLDLWQALQDLALDQELVILPLLVNLILLPHHTFDIHHQQQQPHLSSMYRTLISLLHPYRRQLD